MDTEGGGYTLELQAKKIAENAMNYNGSAPCPTCGVIMNPMEFLQYQGRCVSCVSQERATRIKNRMA